MTGKASGLLVLKPMFKFTFLISAICLMSNALSYVFPACTYLIEVFNRAVAIKHFLAYQIKVTLSCKFIIEVITAIFTGLVIYSRPTFYISGISHLNKCPVNIKFCYIHIQNTFVQFFTEIF